MFMRVCETLWTSDRRERLRAAVPPLGFHEYFPPAAEGPVSCLRLDQEREREIKHQAGIQSEHLEVLNSSERETHETSPANLCRTAQTKSMRDGGRMRLQRSAVRMDLGYWDLRLQTSCTQRTVQRSEVPPPTFTASLRRSSLTLLQQRLCESTPRFDCHVKAGSGARPAQPHGTMRDRSGGIELDAGTVCFGDEEEASVRVTLRLPSVQTTCSWSS